MLFIEFDVGTERNKEVFGKFDSYIRLAKDNPERNMVVLFSVMDESFHYRGDKNVIGKQRLGNIKHFFLKDNKEVPPNLKFKISYRNRIQHIVKRDLIESDKNSVLDSLEVFFDGCHEV